MDWDDVLILYQASAGKTHFLNATSAFVLDLLGEAPSNLGAICEALSREVDDELTVDQVKQLRSHIQRLEELGLVARSAASIE